MCDVVVVVVVSHFSPLVQKHPWGPVVTTHGTLGAAEEKNVHVFDSLLRNTGRPGKHVLGDVSRASDLHVATALLSGTLTSEIVTTVFCENPTGWEVRFPVDCEERLP